MVTHTQNWCSAFNASKCTYTEVSSEHTHCEHAPGAVGSHCSSAQGAVGGSVPCSRTPQSWYWGWRELWLIIKLCHRWRGSSREEWIPSHAAAVRTCSLCSSVPSRRGERVKQALTSVKIMMMFQTRMLLLYLWNTKRDVLQLHAPLAHSYDISSFKYDRRHPKVQRFHATIIHAFGRCFYPKEYI